MPSGPGPLADTDIAPIASAAPANVVTVLLTSRTEPAAIVDHVRETGVRAVQLVQSVPATVRWAVKRALPGVPILQVVHVEGPESLAEAEASAVGADFLLLDSGRPAAATPELGGTGRTHDWSLSADIVARAPLPVFLAGGLRPENVDEAISSVRPAGVDLCSGIRRADVSLDEARLEAFARVVFGA